MAANTNNKLNGSNQKIPIKLSSIVDVRHTTTEDVFIALTKKALETKLNDGKGKFLGYVAKVLEGHTTDLFLNDEYEVDRIDGTTKELQKDSKVVLLHVPSLYSYYINDTVETENAVKFKSNINSIDLYKIPCVTNKNVQPGDIVNVEFENINDYRTATITGLDKKEKKRLNIDVTRFLKAKEVLKEADACKLLNTKEAQGYGIKSKVFLNAGNPTYGFVGLYQKLNDAAKQNVVLKQIVRNKSSSDLTNIGISPSATSNEAYAALITNPSYVFSIFMSANAEISNYIDSNISIKESEKLILLTSDDKNETRQITLEIKGSDGSGELNTTYKGYIAEYLESIITNEYNYSWNPAGDKFTIDIFGKNTVEPSLKQSNPKDIELALQYSSRIENISRNNASSTNPKSVSSPALSDKTPQQTANEAANQPTTTSKPSDETPVCKDASTVNNELYIPVKDAKYFKQDIKRWEKLGIQLKNWFSTGLPLIINGTFFESDSFLTLLQFNNSNFSYSKDVEIISGSPESIKQNTLSQDKSKQNKKEEQKKPIQRGTNSTKIKENLKQLTLFCKELTKLIAINENVSINQVYLMPISVWRKYKKAKRNDGQDDNSRHFFGRAIDFTVYINYDKNIKLESKIIPSNNTYELPNHIIYLYVLALLKLNKVKFGTCGLGLLRGGTKRKSGYVHYEYMRDTSNQNVGLLKNRRWVSQPGEKEKDTVYAKAFGQPDKSKDSIIKDFAFKDIKAKIGTIPEKLENLL